MRYRPIALGLLLATLLACGKSRIELLQERTDSYNRSIRWSSLSAAGTLIAEEVRRTLVARLGKQMSGERVVDYAVVDMGMDEKKQKASVLVEFSYYRVVAQDVKYRQELQIWKYDPRKSNWFLHEARDVPEAAE